MTMDQETRLKAFMKMGFHEEDLKIKDEKKAINLSCGQCKDTVRASECEIVESVISDSNFFKERLQLLCPECKTVVTGADV